MEVDNPGLHEESISLWLADPGVRSEHDKRYNGPIFSAYLLDTLRLVEGKMAGEPVWYDRTAVGRVYFETGEVPEVTDEQTQFIVENYDYTRYENYDRHEESQQWLAMELGGKEGQTLYIFTPRENVENEASRLLEVVQTLLFEVGASGDVSREGDGEMGPLDLDVPVKGLSRESFEENGGNEGEVMVEIELERMGGLGRYVNGRG